MAQAVSRRPLTAEARIRSQFSPCGICSGQSGTGTGFFPRALRYSPVSFIPPVLHYKEKGGKKLIFFITRLHNKPQGCNASVASAAGPFTTKKTLTDLIFASKKISVKITYCGMLPFISLLFIKCSDVCLHGKQGGSDAYTTCF
jgi:hypothetical protein